MRIPTATYRIQFNHTFGFEAARAVTDYLQHLGISDIYASPVFCANPRSMHGYDMTDPTRLNPELGTLDDFNRLMDDIRSKQMGWLQDFVPNHMAYSCHNPWLMDVLEYGPVSPFYGFFDIVWEHPDADLHGRLLAPFLGEPLEETLNKKQLELHYGANGFTLVYYDQRYPVNLYSITEQVQELPEKTLLPYLPGFESAADYAAMQKCKADLFEQYRANAGIQAAVRVFQEKIQNDQPAFKRLLARQHYHLAHWKTAAEKINYRRFFYVNDLICLNAERDDVFEAVHTAVADGYRQGWLTGLRIDHLDGLRYPGRYLNRLRQTFPELYLVAEKILEKDERLPAHWPLQGATGYAFGNYVTAVFCDHQQREVFTRQYADFIGRRPDYDRLLYRQKKKVITAHMQGDIDNLVCLLQQTAAFAGREPDTAAWGQALISLTAAFGVYRTYIEDDTVSDADRAYLLAAVATAGEMEPQQAAILDEILTLFFTSPKNENQMAFITRFQQLTGPAMAKGFEDTLLYIYNPLVSLNEVGSMPEVFGITVEQFHQFNQARMQTPHTMNSTSTHDTKRGEDVRARINILSEMPGEWFEKANAWREMNRPHKRDLDGTPAPDANDEYLIYQVLLGALPVEPQDYDEFCSRLQEYIVKTIREAKRHGNWIEPDEAYEQAAVDFIKNLFNRPEDDPFWRDFVAFWQRVHEYGLMASGAQCLLKMTCPGLPDFYQGTECWDLNLVDPDNRRPVDFEAHRRLLDRLRARLSEDPASLTEWLFAQRNTGLLKLFIIVQTLACRKRRPVLFNEGRYVPIRTEGPRRDNLIAFARIQNGSFALVTVPRLFSQLVGPGQLPEGQTIWRRTRLMLPERLRGEGTDIFTKRRINLQPEMPVETILKGFPVSVIESKE